MINITPEIKPQPKQYLCYQKLFDSTTRFIGFGGGAGGGKTWIGCEWLMMNCYRYPGSKWFIARKKLIDVMGSTFMTWSKMCAFHQVPKEDWKLNGQYHYIEFTNGSRIDLLEVDYKPSDPMYEGLGSLEYTGGFGEEVGEWDFGAFDTLKSRVGRWKNTEFGLFPPKFLLTFNPTQNWLYRIFYKRWRDGTLPEEYAFIQSLYMDNEFTAEEYGKSLSEITDPVTKMRLKDGIWEYSDEDTVLIHYDNIIDMFTNESEFNPNSYITADIARFGSDRTVIGVWRGWNLYKIIIKNHQGVDVTVNDLRVLARDEKISYSHIVVDEDGIGGGVVDTMKGIKGFVANSVAYPTKDDRKENYRNLKTQCSYLLAEAVNNHKIAVTAPIGEADKDFMIEELQQIRRKITNDVGTLQITSKEDVKESLGRSPDIADMMMMRLYFELDKPTVYRYNPAQGFGGVKPFM